MKVVGTYIDEYDIIVTIIVIVVVQQHKPFMAECNNTSAVTINN